MDGKTHQFGGICSGIIVGSFILQTAPPTLSTLAVGGCLLMGSSIGSLLPDLDHHNSTATNRLKQGVFNCVTLPLRLVGLKPTRRKQKHRMSQPDRQRKLDAKRPPALRHRGITHTPFLAMVLMIGLLLAYSFIPSSVQAYYFAFSLGLFTGILNHIFLDALTKKGVPLLGPITYKRFNLMKLTTGRDEWIAILLMIILASASVYFNVFL